MDHPKFETWREEMYAISKIVEDLRKTHGPEDAVPAKVIFELYEKHRIVCLELADKLDHIRKVAQRYLDERALSTPKPPQGTN